MQLKKDWAKKQTLTKKWVCQSALLTNEMTALLNNIDCLFNKKETAGFTVKKILKQEETTFLIVIENKTHSFVIKRYNLKGFFHQLRRLFSRSRAARNWQNAHVLQHLGIATPTPIAYVEKRYGCLRREAFYITDYIQGECACELLPTCALPTQTFFANEIVNSLKKLHQNGFVHGDMKCTNMLVCGKTIFLLDLDAMHYAIFRRQHKIQKDCSRLLRNWLKQPELLTLFKMMLSQK